MTPATPRLHGRSLLRARGRWLIQARWVLALLVGGAGIVAAFHDTEVRAPPLLLVALAYMVSNLLFALLDHHLPLRSRAQEETAVTLQLLGDTVLVAILVAASGGAVSPFLVLFLAPAVSATVLLPRRLSRVVLGACLLVPLPPLFLVGSELAAPFGPWLSWCVLCLAVGFSCVVTSRVMRSLRQHDRRLSAAHDLLEERVRCLDEARDKEHALQRQVEDLSRHSLIAELCTQIAGRVREPMGIVRARAESLRLSERLAEGGAEEQHDLDVLLRNLDVVQRGLRGILAWLPPPRVRARVELEPLAQAEVRRIGLAPERLLVAGRQGLPAVRGSFEELELTTGLLLRVAQEGCDPRGRIRVRVRQREGRVEVDLRWTASRDQAEQADQGGDQTGVFLRTSIAQRVLEKHGGTLEASPRSGRLRAVMPLEERAWAAAQNGTPRPARPAPVPPRGTGAPRG